MVRIGVLNISDRASAGVYADEPGQACLALLREWLSTAFEPDYKVIPDEQPVIEAELRRMADDAGCCLIVTTGGTGPAPRDVTPEATAAVCESYYRDSVNSCARLRSSLWRPRFFQGRSRALAEKR